MNEWGSRLSTRTNLPGTPATPKRIAEAINPINGHIPEGVLTVPNGLTVRRDDENIYYDVLDTAFFQPWFSGAVLGHGPKINNQRRDHILIASINQSDHKGKFLEELIGQPSVDIFIAQNTYKARRRISQHTNDHFQGDYATDESDRLEVVVNAKDNPDTIAADIAVQMLGFTRAIHDTIMIGDFVSIMPPALRSLFIERKSIIRLIRARYPFIELLNPSNVHREVVIKALADELVDAALDNYEE